MDVRERDVQKAYKWTDEVTPGAPTLSMGDWAHWEHNKNCA